ncbi:hypothetical protein H9P43_009087 [Blastocladiella emersonii ATCC 22665]|nr:hypothetical protein H9P43_009087 [Blastocladiella emersonii ATCC 22665]
MATSRRTSSPLLALLAALAVVTTLLAAAADPVAAQCRVRKEIRSLSSSERAALRRGFTNLYTSGAMDRLRATHTANVGIAHGSPNFLLWHRAFNLQFENELLAAAGGGLSGAPYIDLSADAANPAASGIFASDLLGANGDCVGAPYDSFKLNGACLKRVAPQGNWGGCASAVIASMIRGAPEYTAFSTQLEGVCHNRVHSSFPDSPLFYTTQSTADPLFYPFHIGLDRYLAMWQNVNSKANMDMNQSFLGRSVGALLAYSSGSECYTYDNVNAPSAVDPPKSTSSSSAAATSTTSASATATTTSAAPTATPTDGANGGKDSSAPSTDASTWIPPFETIPESFFKAMGMNMPPEMIEGWNRAFRSVLTYLQRLKAEGKPIPTLADLRNISGNNAWTPDGVKKLQQGQNQQGATGSQDAASQVAAAAGVDAGALGKAAIGAAVAAAFAAFGM